MHVYDVEDSIDYLAGKDEDRLADIYDVLHDPGVKAIITTRGGKSAYRIADGLDFCSGPQQSEAFDRFQ